MKKFYHIALQTICIDAPHFSHDCKYWKPFELSTDKMSDKADFDITCHITDTLPIPENTAAISKNDISVRTKNGIIYREKAMGTAKGALICYNPDDISKSEAYFTPQSYNTMTDSRYMWASIAIAQLLLEKNTVLMHSSYISIGEKAVLFCAPSGTGKSTQADLWHKHRNAKIINGDKSAVSVNGGKVYAHGVPFCGTSDICLNESYPLGAIVMLYKSEINTISHLTGIAAIQKMTENIYLDFLAPDEQRKCVDVIIDILSSVPVYSLGCTPDENAVITLETQLRKEGLI